MAAVARQDMTGYAIEPPPAAALTTSNTARNRAMEDPEVRLGSAWEYEPLRKCGGRHCSVKAEARLGS